MADENEEELSEVAPAELALFQRNAEEYASCENEIKRLSVQVRELKSRQKELKPDITIFMRDQDLDRADLSNGTIKYTQSKSVKPLNKENMNRWIADFFHGNVAETKTYREGVPEKKAEMITEHVFNVRDHTTRERISSLAPR